MSQLTTNQEYLIYWINERENIRIRKESGNLRPWTTDEIFKTTYFCNVHREDDKVTRWIRQNIPYLGDGYDEWRMMVARMFNKPETISLLNPTLPFDADAWLGILDRIAKSGETIWGSAYVVTTCGAKMSKALYCVEALGAAFAAPPIVPIGSTLASAYEQIKRYQGFASFMSGQVVADLKNMDGHPLTKAGDWWTWSTPGPGSLRGLNWFWSETLRPSNFSYHIGRAYSLIKDKIPEMCMQDFQNCLCEYDKFMRVKNGTGRSKRKYDGFSRSS